jgi:ankyrin repeat protein
MNALQSEVTEGDLRDALGNLAKGENKLEKAYEQTMDRVQNQDDSPKRLAIQTLAWIFHARRPLTITELLHAMAVRPAKSTLDESYIPNVEVLLSVCAGLVRLDEKTKVVDLIHKTTRDYFEITKETWFKDQQSNITTVCVTYLSFNAFKSGYCQTDEEFEERLRSNPLYGYAAKYWGYHAQAALTLCQGVMEFLQEQLQVEASNQAILAAKLYSSEDCYSQRFPKDIIGLHLAAYFGVEIAVKLLLNKGADVKAAASDGQTPLHWASMNGHLEVAQLLLERGADIDVPDSLRRMPLHRASANGHLEIVQLLLKNRAGVNVADGHRWTPLQLASANGHLDIARLLLANSADGNAAGSDGWTPLHWASVNGHLEIVQLLLEWGADIDVFDIKGFTPLQWASRNKHEAIVELLFGKRADASDMDLNEIKTQPARALENYHMELLLLEKANRERLTMAGQFRALGSRNLGS